MSDLYIDITYPVAHPNKYKIKSNIRKEMLLDMLGELVHMQLGEGEDKSKAKKLNAYHIHIELDLNYDDFSIKSDTGNKGLTLGIIMDVISRMEDARK